MLEMVPIRLLEKEELVVDVNSVEFETGVAKVRLVGPFDPVLDCEDIEARRTR